ncbi:oxidoreductase [uncultured Psychroserpens sp.]|uniref:WD40/YVTN/BNR-like repeat-containing protein n=1 Tax=uncultured Psychroserpens sp. TaxID=255436 RepID=UPI002603E37C|nr:oxidoreductase [uncultured Psychroserpens sp.]
MKRLLVVLLGPIVIIGLGSCGLFNHNINKYKPIKNRFSKVDIETLVQDSTLNVRAIEIVDAVGLVYLTSNGGLGVYYKDDFDMPESLKEDFPIYLKYDSIVPNFRALAVSNDAGFGISIGSPALLYKLDVDIEKNKVIYKEDHPKAFYDSMEFWNAKEGIAIGDSVDGCLSVIITRDGGDTWTKLTCDQLPEGIEGEGAFAASDTNIAIIGDKTWVATTAGRIYYSEDKGVSWDTIDTPIMKAKDTEGIYSIDFYDDMNGFGIGGDYTKAADSSANKIRTQDGGKTWQLVAQNQSPGYRSCVQYVPGSNAEELVAIGFKGIDYSADSGNTWSHLSDEGFYTIRFLNDSVAYAAGSGRVSKLTFKK